MLSEKMKKSLINFLEEDNPFIDLTSELIDEKKVKAKIICQEDCLLSGLDEAVYLFESQGLKVKKFSEQGREVKKNQKILEVTGSNKKIFLIERTALNILSRMSGISTNCFNAVKKAEKHGVRIALTRKTAPGLNLFDKKAAMLAGADTHRLNLSDMVLIKDNHLTQTSIKQILLKARKQASFSKKIEIEVDSKKQAMEAVKYHPDIIMLDNFSPERAEEAILFIRKNSKCLIELSGGINESNLESFLKLKPDIISMGSLTGNVKSINFSLVVE